MLDKTLFAPWLIDCEFISVARKKYRSNSEGFVDAVVEDFLRLVIHRRQPDVSHQWELVKTHGLSAYDAAYLQLAMDLKAPLATFDEQLARVASQVLGDE